MAKTYETALTGTLDDEIRWRKLGLHKYELYNNTGAIDIETYAVIDFLGDYTLYEDKEFKEIDEEGYLCCTDVRVYIGRIDFIGIL